MLRLSHLVNHPGTSARLIRLTEWPSHRPSHWTAGTARTAHCARSCSSAAVMLLAFASQKDESMSACLRLDLGPPPVGERPGCGQPVPALVVRAGVTV